MRYIQNKDIVIRRVDACIFLVNPQSDALYQLDSTGSVLWLALAEPLDIDEAIKLLLIVFPEANPGTVASDVETLLEDLSNHHLITPVE